MICEIDGREIEYGPDTKFEVQIGRGSGSYRTKYSFAGKPGSAVMYYRGVNVGRGYKKRLVAGGKVIARMFSA